MNCSGVVVFFWSTIATSAAGEGGRVEQGASGFECQTRGRGGGPRALKKIYYSNQKLVEWPSISLSVALQLF